MHGLDEALLHHGQLNVLLVAAFALHLCRDTADDDDGISILHLLGQFGELGQVALADVGAEHGEVAVAAAILDGEVVGLASLHWERLVFRLAAEETAATAIWLRVFHHLVVHAQHIAVVAHHGVLHVARESGLILAADAQ